jgi:YVTN family beta-propeller protein
VRTVAVGAHPGAIALDERRGHVFVANEYDHSVSMLEAASGRVVRTIDVDLTPHGLAVDQRAGRVFVSTGEDLLWPSPTPGWVQVLDSRTGQLLRTVAVGLGPAALAVDARTGHVFVANLYGPATDPDSLSRLVTWSRDRLPAWGQPWLAWLTPPAPATHSAAGSMSVLDGDHP